MKKSLIFIKFLIVAAISNSPSQAYIGGHLNPFFRHVSVSHLLKDEPTKVLDAKDLRIGKIIYCLFRKDPSRKTFVVDNKSITCEFPNPFLSNPFIYHENIIAPEWIKFCRPFDDSDVDEESYCEDLCLEVCKKNECLGVCSECQLGKVPIEVHIDYIDDYEDDEVILDETLKRISHELIDNEDSPESFDISLIRANDFTETLQEFFGQDYQQNPHAWSFDIASDVLCTMRESFKKTCEEGGDVQIYLRRFNQKLRVLKEKWILEPEEKVQPVDGVADGKVGHNYSEVILQQANALALRVALHAYLQSLSNWFSE